MTVASISNNLMKNRYTSVVISRFIFFKIKATTFVNMTNTPTKNIYYVCRDVNLSGEPATKLILQNSE